MLIPTRHCFYLPALHRGLVLGLVRLLLVACALTACSQPTPIATPLPAEISFYGWGSYGRTAVFAAFEREYGIKVVAHEYGAQEAAIENIRQGQVFDVVVMGNELVPTMLADNLLAQLNYANLPNFKNVSANFRDLAYDPKNRHAVPFMWGSTGILVRTDLAPRPVTSWNDFWAPEFAGKGGMWEVEGTLFQLTLLSMGKSANTTDPADLEAALAKLLLLKKNTLPIDLAAPTVVPDLQSGRVVMAFGYSYDYAEALAAGLPVTYVVPVEGTMLWGDNLVIPANSPNQHAAELLINFILQPEINAQLITDLRYATAIDAARPYLPAEILENPAIYLPTNLIRKSEIVLPLPADTLAYRHDLWLTYLAANR